eukprot:gene3277-3758_t
MNQQADGIMMVKNGSEHPVGFCLIVPEYKIYTSDASFYNNIIINATVNIVFAALSTVLNCSVIWVIYSCERLWTPYYLTLLSLAVTDLTAGLIAQPLYIVRMLLLVTRKQSFCGLDISVIAVGYSLLAVSFFTVSYITAERYVAVFYPFYYEQHYKGSTTCRWLLSIWLVGIIYGVIGSLPYKSTRTVFIIMVSVVGTFCLIGNGFAYAKIFVSASRIRRRIRRQQKRFLGDEKLVKAANAAKTTCIIVSSLFVFYGPAFITTAIGEADRNFPLYINVWAYTFMLMNSAANPIVYCYCCREIGHRMKRTFRYCCCCCCDTSDQLNDFERSLQQNSIGLVSIRKRERFQN